MYCKECQPIMHAELDRRKSIEYYRKNKETINPIRNARRHVPERRCVVCGSLFQPKGQQITCSIECRKDWFRSLRNTIYNPRIRWKLKNPEKD